VQRNHRATRTTSTAKAWRARTCR